MLTLVFTLNYVDRCLIALLLDPIKADLHLSDTQLGFLTGIAFGAFYATLGLPIARWADRGNRVTITSLAIGLWGLTVMACLLVRNFTQLLSARVAAACGEAGCMPPTYSLIGDYFPGAASRAGAMSVYWLASPLSSLFAFIVGGRLYAHYGWRMTFFLMGIPALIIAMAVKLTIQEPRQHQRERTSPSRRESRLTDVLVLLWKRQSARHLSIAIVLLFTMALGLAPWYAAFLMRSHGMETAALGLWLGIIFGLGGLVGIPLGGFVTQRWLAGKERGQLRLSAAMFVLLTPCFIAFLMLPGRSQALIALLPLVTVFSFFFGPIFAILQRLVRSDMRATALSVVMLLANLIGMGVGPQTVGILSDALRPHFGNDSLRYSMLTMSLLSLWVAYHFWRSAEAIGVDLGLVERSVRPR